MMHISHLTKYQRIGFAAALLILLVASVAGVATREAKGTDYSNDVRVVVEDFGRVLQNVSLTSDPDELARQIDAAYSAYLTDELRAVWKSDSTDAIGRSSSSPWPARIDVGTITKNPDETYTALGMVIEVTNESTVPVAIYPVALTLVDRDGVWRIQDATKGTYIAVPERRSMKGTYVCLSHVDLMDETDECALGLRAHDGRQYALDFTVLQSSDIMSRLVTGQEVTVEGTFVPVEHLSATNYWMRYSIEAVVRVTSLEEAD